MRFFKTLLVVALTQALPALAATKIMAFGDSITGSPGCWRALLWQKLIAGGYTNIDFVGTLAGQGCGFAYDGENEGHGGYLATNIASQNQLVPWLASSQPDIVLMHLGTNDVWSNIAPSVILEAFSKLVDQMRASKSTMKILVAQIIPMAPPTCTECGARVVALNAAIVPWAASKSTAASPIVVVDQWTGFVPATDTYDGVHPGDTGIVKIADKWYPPLVAALSGTVTPVTTTKASSTSTIKTSTTKTSTAPAATNTQGTAGAWGQCGGIGFSGPTSCISGYTCKVSNPYYSQCLPN
ncbi:SGNH hydrolase-type esterase domain-containing protein [Peziza echinospora]|nr:SGNH hydrolase-type esterase domain-containing protein [Peziza echinospora]